MVPKKFANVGKSGSFKSWAREVKDYARIADSETLELFKIGVPQQLENLDHDLHYFISRFLDGEAKLLSINADIGTFAKGDATEKKTRNKTTTRQFARKYMSERDSVHF